MRTRATIFSTFLDKCSPPEGLLFFVLSIIVGAGTGLAAVIFIRLILAVQYLCYVIIPKRLPELGLFTYLLMPVLGGLLVIPFLLYAREIKSSGVPEVMRALILKGGRIRKRVFGTKIIASAICIGTGGSAGREGPIVQIGASIGSSIGQILRLSDDRIRNLVGCGTASAIAAAFNTPLAGIVFAIEVLMGNLQVRSFGNVVIAAVSASIVSRFFLGTSPAFSVPIHALDSPIALFFYLILGLLSALVGIMFIQMLYKTEALFDNWKIPFLLKPAIGATLLGIIGMIFMSLPIAEGRQIPVMFCTGYFFVEEVLLGNVSLWLLLALVFIKPLATSLTLGSGSAGGVFGPALFLGAVLGGALGIICKHFFPEISGEPGAYALVGMAAMFSATARAPLTGMLTVFELSNDYLMILPMMVAGITACYFAQWLHPDSIFTLKLSQKGIRFADGRDMDIMQGVTVQEVMRTRLVSVNRNQSVSELMALFQETNLLGFPVITEGNKLWGIITLQDIHRAQSAPDFNPRHLKVADLAVEEAITVYPDEPIWVAIQKMSPRDLARLPVISRDGSLRLVGVISRSDILRAYDVGIVRKQRGRLAEKQTTLRESAEAGFGEIVLNEDDTCIDIAIKDLPIPEQVNLVSIKREGRVIIPRGSHRLQAGDVLTFFGQPSEIEDLKIFLNNELTIPPAAAGYREKQQGGS